MALTLSQDQYDALQAASAYVTTADAPQFPFDESFAERIAPVAVEVGFINSTGAFLEAVKNKPLTTLLDLAAFIGAP